MWPQLIFQFVTVSEGSGVFEMSLELLEKCSKRQNAAVN